MAMSPLSRRLNPRKLLPLISQNPSLYYSLSKTLNPNPNPLLFQSPILQSISRRLHSSSPPPDSPPPQSSSADLRHQEIVGPTVERDESALANETRQALESLGKSIYRLSSAMALLSAAHLGVGAWLAYSAPTPAVADEAVVQGLMAFVFPFTAAFLMRRSLKPIAFFRKMESQARLQILTLCLQVAKSVNLLLLRTRVVAISCAAGVSVGSVAAILMR